jgi:hypothetical protein
LDYALEELKLEAFEEDLLIKHVKFEEIKKLEIVQSLVILLVVA